LERACNLLLLSGASRMFFCDDFDRPENFLIFLNEDSILSSQALFTPGWEGEALPKNKLN
jgi:hypothetical protein